MRLPPSNYRRVFSFALIGGVGLGVIAYGLLQTLARLGAGSLPVRVAGAILVGTLIGAAMALAIKLVLRQNAYDLHYHAEEQAQASLPSPEEVGARDEIVYMRETVTRALASIPRHHEYPRLAGELTAAQDLSGGLAAAVESLEAHIPIQGAALLLLDSERHQLYIGASRGVIALSPSLTLDAHGTAIGRALQEQRPLLYSVGQSSGLLPLTGASEATALFCLPLIVRGDPMGVLCLAYRSADLRLNDEQQLYARGVSDLFSLAIQGILHQRLYHRESERLAAFERLAASLGDTAEFDEALVQILQSAARITDSDHGTLMILESDESRVRQRIALDHGRATSLTLVAAPVIKHGLAGWAIRERRADIIDDTERDTRWLPVPGLAEMRSALVVPLLFGQRVLGVLTLAHPFPSHYSQRGLAIVAGLAAYAVNIVSRRASEAGPPDELAAQARRLLDRRLAPADLDAALANGGPARLLAPRTYPVVAIHAAIRPFDLAADEGPPESVLEEVFLPFADELSVAALEHGAFLERCDGESVVAIFGFPNSRDDDAQRACSAALAMQTAARRLRSRWRSALGREIAVGIGVARGQAMVGSTALSLVVSGPAIAAAARLHALTRKDEVLVAADVLDQRASEGGFRLDPLDLPADPDTGLPQQVLRLLPRT